MSKINTVMRELTASDFGSLLQDGKIIKMRAGKAVIEQTKKTRGKPNVTTYHVNLGPQIVHQEIAEEVAAPTKRKPRAKKTAESKAEKPVKRKPRAKKAAAPKTEKTEKPKTPSKRKQRVKKAAAPTSAPKTEKPKKAPKSGPANIPWGSDDDELDADDYKV
ncbi:hypothetical protein LCGC14_0829590 [marine sediment metagenome]|uniref:Uncharacterized protein n=1 Tax=marine sediment metagenome TaxID=412755 RepID=A0A0F9PL44_9ZZZZ